MKELADSIKIHLRMWGINLRAALMNRLSNRLNFAIICLSVIIQMILTLVFIRVVFKFIDKLSGWTFDQALIIVASYMLIEGLMWGSCAYLGGIYKSIYTGSLDYILVKPKDAQFLVTIWRGDPEDWFRVMFAAAVFIYAVRQMHFTAMQFLHNFGWYTVLIISGFLMLYSITLIVKSILFWTIEATSIWQIVENFTRMSQYPTDIFYHKFIQIFFSTVIPLAFMATIPAKILLFGPNYKMIFASILLAITFLFISRKFWLFALRHYTSASS